MTELQHVEFSHRIHTIWRVIAAFERAHDIPSSGATTLKVLLNDIEDYLDEIKKEENNS